MTARTRYLFAVPALGFALTALVFATGAFDGRDVPPQELPIDSAAATPSDLSPNATTRDWEEMAGSGTKRRFR